MINERLRKRLSKDRRNTMISVRVPADILESLESTASARGFNSYQTLLKRYITAGLRRDETEVAPQTDRGHPKEVKDNARTRKNPHLGSGSMPPLRRKAFMRKPRLPASDA
jgi:hypothetical protein